MTMTTPAAGATAAVPPAKLDEMMIAMDVVDTLRHRDVMIERELNEEGREQELIERLRSLYKSQGLEVTDSVIAQGVKALKESRFVYTPPPPSYGRTLATLWVKRNTYGKWAGGVLAVLLVIFGVYHFSVTRPRQQKAETARVELKETLPRQLAAAHQAITTEAQVPAARQQADAILAQG